MDAIFAPSQNGLVLDVIKIIFSSFFHIWYSIKFSF